MLIKKSKLILLFFYFHLCIADQCFYYFKPINFINFGDYLSLKLFERIINQSFEVCQSNNVKQKKILGIGSIIHHASDNDVIWGSGINGRFVDKKYYRFKKLDVRAVRGPLTREYLMKNFSIKCPEIYGDPALLIPYFFPEFKKTENPTFEYIIIPHYSEEHLFKDTKYKNIVSTKEPWDQIIKKVLNSKFVISSSLHGIIIAEAFNIPARLLKITNNEPLFKYQDYYYGTNRFNFKYATSVEEALQMGGETPFVCDLKKLYSVCPLEFWSKDKIRKELY